MSCSCVKVDVAIINSTRLEVFTIVYTLKCYHNVVIGICTKQARKQGGIRGGSLEPPYWPRFIHRQLAILSALPFVVVLSLNAVRTSLVAAVHPANRARKRSTPLR